MKPRAWMESALIKQGEDPGDFACLYPEREVAGTVVEAAQCGLAEIPEDCVEFTCWPPDGQPHYTFKLKPFPHIIREVRDRGRGGRILMTVTEQGRIGRCSLCENAWTPQYCASCRPPHRVCGNCWESHQLVVCGRLEPPS